MMRAAAVVSVNGRFVARSHAMINVFDRGFLYGDGLFETMRAYGGVVFALDAHLERLQASARALDLSVPPLNWHALCAALLRRNRLQRRDAWIRLVITRGVSDSGLQPTRRVRPTTVAMVGPVDARRGSVPVSAVLLPFARDAWLAEHKSLNYLIGVVGKAAAARRGAGEGLYVDGRGAVREGTTTSLFVVQHGRLYTPPVDGILPGVTRRVVLDLAADGGIPTRERRLTVTDLVGSDEVFLTSSVAEIVPVARVDRHRIGNGRIGPVTGCVQQLYRGAVERYCAEERASGVAANSSGRPQRSVPGRGKGSVGLQLHSVARAGDRPK